ncbi:MAG TPA: amino acid adenylation domain-containing protein, partial [Bacillota bacterium]|nr:amino acid adenylation domain-containing protein [Bacillota bacterium]
LKPDNFVAIMMERSCDYVFALIATLKAGGAFVPIDPSLPDQRIKLILKECRPVLLLTHSALRSRASSLTDNWLNIDRANIFTGDKGPLDNRNSLSDIAYIIYTSGSSGKPKGVMNTHGNLLNFCQWSKDFYQLEEGDSHAAYCNFAFDVSIAELVPPLMVGSSLHIIPEGIRLSIPAINKYFKKHRITVATFPTRVGELFIQEDNKSLRILTLAGEKFNRFKGQNYCMVNAYGPTEATIYATAYKIDGDSDNIPIGLPLANTWAYVVDKKGRLLPKGLAGELWLSGPHIARGYLNDPEQTGQVFISNPYRTGDENPIVYKSGDLVRHRGDGNLEFLSRLDQQVKLRGHRIETSEIEKHLLAHKSVKKAVVTKTKLSNTSSLCAYIEGDKGLDLDQVQDELKVTLPPYMVPDYFKQVAYIPMTPNGKIDYDRLNASLRGVIPKKRQANKEAKPKTPTQIKLATIWKDVLNIPQVNCSDTFFDLGGDSLSVMVLSVRIEESFKLDIPPHLLYKESTIKKQSALIEGRVNNDRAFVVELAGNLHASEQAKRPIFCIHDITGELLSYAHLADSLGETYPVYGIRGQKKNTAKELSLEDLVASYIDGIKAIQPTGPYSLVGYSSGGMLAFEMAKQLHQKGDRLSLLALVDTPNYAKYPARNIYLMALRNVLPWLKDIPLKNLPPLACFTIKKVSQVLFKPNNYSPAKIKTAINRYLPEPYPGRLVLFRTNWRAGEKDQSLGWDGIAQLGLDLIHTEGNHISVMNITNSKQLAKKIIEILGDE